ncbi:MAG: RnfABCDGE type electron transport complex subunit B [Gammaproteobacteria bacterium]|nr:RnfABCDGE type electron transport complex subunit B [Gammaproteobacteria bacterium]
MALLGGLACAVHPLNRRGLQRKQWLADRIDALLPQTQCGLCGYSGCRPYAEAVAGGLADINRCPPGGDHTITLLAELLGTVPKTLDPALAPVVNARLAHIDEAACIGCLKCVRACPVDAILGAAGQMHTVIPQFCTGCGLCVAPCPVDCIDLRPPVAAPGKPVWPKPGPAYGRAA